MTEELLDLVDKHDRVIGAVTRAAAHKDPALRHREVAILLHNRQGQVLLCRRPLSKKVNPGAWAASAAGHVSAGEEPSVCAYRELEEELSVACDLTFVGKAEVRESEESYFAYCYTGLLPAAAELLCDPAEVAETCLCGLEEAEELLRLDRPTGAVHRQLLAAVRATS